MVGLYTVSYTHLDVYKRQSNGFTVWISPVDKWIFPKSNSSSDTACFLIRLLYSPERNGPIWETGDVYKRQLLFLINREEPQLHFLKRAALFSVFLMLVLSLSACSSRTAVTEDAFTAAMDKLGFTDQTPEDLSLIHILVPRLIQQRPILLRMKSWPPILQTTL